MDSNLRKYFKQCKLGHRFTDSNTYIKFHFGTKILGCKKCDKIEKFSCKKTSKNNQSPIDRFFNKIRLPSEGLITMCWFWNGSKTMHNYSQFGKTSGHRFSYEYFKGKIPKGLEIHHICHNKDCVNPDHLEAVTHLINTRDKISQRY